METQPLGLHTLNDKKRKQSSVTLGKTSNNNNVIFSTKDQANYISDIPGISSL